MAKIVVVDDEPQMRELLAEVLPEEFSVVGEAGDGEEALKVSSTF